MIKIALVDDHVILRKSLAVLIGMFHDFEVIIEAANGQDFINQLKPGTTLPDIALLDITMPVMDGVETAKWLKQNHPRVKVMALSMLKNDLVVIRMLKNGARGYILKDCEPTELRAALQEVYDKGYYYNELLTHGMKVRDKKADDGVVRVMMNEKELIFLRWVCTEKSYKEIADEMAVSVRTVDGYREALFRKLNVNTRIGLAIYAIRNGIVLL